jgi:hypothetical protein
MIFLLSRNKTASKVCQSIFQFIQDYSQEKDYRNLMNTNLSTFQPVKSETVKYSLTGPKAWNRMSPYKVDYKEAIVLQMIKNVKDKSKQISMSFSEVKQPTVLKYSHLFEGIYKLHLSGAKQQHCPFENMFPFEVFDNIHHLILENVHGISTLKFAPRNTVKLQLSYCDSHD